MLAHCQSDKLSHKVRYPKSETAAVSIGAKPMSSFAVHRSSALPIALKRPIRKVSFSDLSDLESNMSGIKSVPQLHSIMLRSSSSASPRSYTLRDAVFNRVPESPACSQHSEVAESEDSKVRGGHLYESDCNSSSASLNSHADTISGLDTASSASIHLTPQASPPKPVSAAEAYQPSSSDAAVCWSDLNKLNLCSVPTPADAGSPPASPPGHLSISGKGQSSPSSSISTDESSCSGHKTRGGNLFGSAGTHTAISAVCFMSSTCVEHQQCDFLALSDSSEGKCKTALLFPSYCTSLSTQHHTPQSIQHCNVVSKCNERVCIQANAIW